MAWVKVQDSFVFNDRLAIAEIDRVDFINFGGTAEDFHLLLEQDVDEDLIKRLLANIYGNIDNWVLIRIAFEIAPIRYAILVSSPDFDRRADYSEIKRVERKQVNVVTEDGNAPENLPSVDPRAPDVELTPAPNACPERDGVRRDQNGNLRSQSNAGDMEQKDHVLRLARGALTKDRDLNRFIELLEIYVDSETDEILETNPLYGYWAMGGAAQKED